MAASSSTSVSSPASESTETGTRIEPSTFGFELELIIAFQGPQLVDIIEKYDIPVHINDKGVPFVKDLTTDQHEGLLTTLNTQRTEDSHACRDEYPSWGVSAPQSDQDPYISMVQREKMSLAAGESGSHLRRHMAEHLLIVRDAITTQHRAAPIDVRAYLTPGEAVQLPNAHSNDFLRCQSTDFSRWTLTNDHTLMGSLKSQLLAALPNKINESNINDWDSASVELISPVFRLSDQQGYAMKELGDYLSAIKDSQTTDILTSKWAGMHVHIGFNIKTPEQLNENVPFFQHLVYILLRNEDMISQCFPRKCSGIESKEPEVEPENEQGQAQVPSALSEEQREARIAELEKEIAALDESDELRNTLQCRIYNLQDGLDERAGESEDEPEPELSEQELAQQRHLANEARVLKAEAAYKGHHSIDGNIRYVASTLGHKHTLTNPLPTNTLAATIFHKTQSFTDLINLIQRPKDTNNPYGERFRGYMYNFANLYNIALGTRVEETWKVPKPTVEFRQHECTVDAEEVGRWVRFTESVCRKAGEMATLETGGKEEEGEYAENEAGKYGDKGSGSMREYCAWLGLGGEDGEYWQERWERNCGDRPEE